jgi:hypothetical protein
MQLKWVIWIVTVLVLTGIALTQSQNPGYPERVRYIVSAPDYRLDRLHLLRWPYIEVLRVDRWQEHQQARAQGQGPVAHEWRLPMSDLLTSQEVARDVRLAWQRFEERYYWHVITRLNNPALYVIFCWAGLQGPDLNPPLPEARVDVSSGIVPQGFNPNLGWPLPAAQGQHMLDAYWPIPQIRNEDFCDNLSLQILPLMHIPGFCIDIPAIGFSWCTPGYDEGIPLWFNDVEAQNRVSDGIAHAVSHYYPDYKIDVLNALRPRVPTDLSDPTRLRVFAPMPWQAHVLEGGAVVTPVMRTLDGLAPQHFVNDVQQIFSILNQGIAALPEAERVAGAAYYYQAVRSLARLSFLQPVTSQLRGLIGGMDEQVMEQALRAMTTTDQASKLAGQDLHIYARNAPGAWRLEELKRWLPPSNPFIYEHFGYVSFFQVFNRLEVTTVPDFRADRNPLGVAASLGMRALFYWWVPVRIQVHLTPTPPYITLTGSLDLPRPIPVPPYVLPFAGERTFWGWVSVPEGYEIPRVRGTPGLGISGVSIPGFGPEIYNILLR